MSTAVETKITVDAQNRLVDIGQRKPLEIAFTTITVPFDMLDVIYCARLQAQLQRNAPTQPPATDSAIVGHIGA